MKASSGASLGWILIKDRVVWGAGALVVLAAVGLGLTSHPDVGRALERAAAVALFVVTLGAGLATASVWGTIADADLEGTIHDCGSSPRWARVRIWLMLQAGAGAASVLLLAVAAGAALLAPQPDEAGSVGSGRTTLWLLLALPSTVAVATVVPWGRTRTQALVRTMAIVVIPLVAFFGPRASTRSLLVALSPTTAPTVLVAPSQYPVGAVVIASVSTTLAWIGVVVVLMGPSRASTQVTSLSARASWRGRLWTRPRMPRWPVLVCVLVLLLGSFLPALGEQIPYQRRYAASVQQARHAGPDDALRTYLTAYGQGRLETAALWAAHGEVHAPLAEIPTPSVPVVANAPMTVVRSESITDATVAIQARGKEFYGCLVRNAQQWLVTRVSTKESCD